jgi:signal peptidase I
MQKQNPHERKGKGKSPLPPIGQKKTFMDFLKRLFFGKKAVDENKTSSKDFIKEISIVFGIFLVLNSFVLASFEVPTGSMENTVMTGDFLFVNKFIYGGTSPRTVPFTSIRIPWFRIPGLKDVQRQDVIVFEFPGNREEVKTDFVYYLKRCVALPGDSLQVIKKVLYINGVQQPIPKYMKFENMYTQPEGIKNDNIFPPLADFNEDNYGPIRIPKKGDVIDVNIANFANWKIFIEREGHQTFTEGSFILIDGKPTSKYTVEHDYYFGMGDNRDNSLDSRFWGFIPKENIVGTPMIVYWSWDPNLPIFDIFKKLSSIKFKRIGTIIR